MAARRRGGDVRSLATPAITWLAVSPNGKRLGLAFADGRLAALDLDAAFAHAPTSANRLARPPIPAQCGSASAFDSPPAPPDKPEPPDDTADYPDGDD